MAIAPGLVVAMAAAAAADMGTVRFDKPQVELGRQAGRGD